MKRLLAAGSGPIFQIVKAFRAGEIGRLHAAEFTIAEWYRSGPVSGLLAEIDLLLQHLLAAPPAVVKSYRELFRAGVGVDPLAASGPALGTLALAHGHPGPRPDRPDALNYLFARLVEPGMGPKRPVFVTRFPAPLSALARLSDDDPRTAERFEVFYRGVELANGYDELRDPEEHQRRFRAENAARERDGRPPVTPDPRLLEALISPGLPRCSGVALGVDRLVMLALDTERIDDVMAFRETLPRR